ncbi:hypothetical protein [Streptomyces spectabilis]|uniref:Uncharacterized protein n=1 Tax=Streptomyces spectabilis TaxID=68270 RepID=A0A5P2X2I7_STRST|nr:hypothetical protein [Streptomyces spectabilis]MBB5108360.1 hypothetical protein [Streptomyces spectabilis]MCI3901117.1 hypothetical protein [Streptomyces spectabilis]QEV58608.1 hypothetical protein CP982_07655 [Streptomyces spectabilis]GGV46067.1 hypothetical protein GCM10010245_72220 [Streptomyces spectabilis]
MPRLIRARDIDAVLAPYPHSEWVGDDWIPGWRTAQDGRRQVNVFHDGPGETDGLEKYRLELQAAGYCVIPDQQLGGGRRRLHITHT